MYDLENVQSQLDKALGQSARLQKERETTQLEVDRIRDKYEKSQVRTLDFSSIVLLIHMSILRLLSVAFKKKETASKTNATNSKRG